MTFLAVQLPVERKLTHAHHPATLSGSMRWRWTAALITLLFLSSASIVSMLHHHDGDLPVGHQQCAACTWHKEAISDLHDSSPRVRPPVPALTHYADPDVSAPSRRDLFWFTRGPPCFA